MAKAPAGAEGESGEWLKEGLAKFYDMSEDSNMVLRICGCCIWKGRLCEVFDEVFSIVEGLYFVSSFSVSGSGCLPEAFSLQPTDLHLIHSFFQAVKKSAELLILLEATCNLSQLFQGPDPDNLSVIERLRWVS